MVQSLDVIEYIKNWYLQQLKNNKNLENEFIRAIMAYIKNIDSENPITISMPKTIWWMKITLQKEYDKKSYDEMIENLWEEYKKLFINLYK